MKFLFTKFCTNTVILLVWSYYHSSFSPIRKLRLRDYAALGKSLQVNERASSSRLKSNFLESTETNSTSSTFKDGVSISLATSLAGGKCYGYYKYPFRMSTQNLIIECFSYEQQNSGYSVRTGLARAHHRFQVN